MQGLVVKGALVDPDDAEGAVVRRKRYPALRVGPVVAHAARRRNAASEGTAVTLREASPGGLWERLGGGG